MNLDRTVSQKPLFDMPDALQEEKHFESLASLANYDRLRTPIWIFDVDRHGVWWGNESAIEFWQAKDLSDLRKRDFSSDSEVVRERLAQMVAPENAGLRFQESWTLYPQGKPTTVFVEFLPILIDQDRRRALLIELSYPIDFSQDPQAHRILEAVRNTPLMVTTFTLEGIILAENPAAVERYGKSANETRPGKRDLFSRFEDEGQAKACQESVRADRSFQGDCQMRTAHGQCWHKVTARRGRDPISGQVVMVVTEEDISDHYRLREDLEALNAALEERIETRTAALRQSDEQLRLITDNLPVLIAQVDSQDRLVFVNQVYVDWFEKPKSEAIGKEITSIFQGEPVDSQVANVHQGEQVTFDSEVRINDGDLRQVSASFVPQRANDGTIIGYFALISDITDRILAERRLQRSQRMEAVGQLTGGIAHDFNNLLAVILGHAELMDDISGPESVHAETILKAASRGADLTQRLLAFSRRQHLQPQSVDLRKLLDDLLLLLQSVLGETIDTAVELPEDLWAAHIDPGQLENALLNLAINARDAMPEGGRLIFACRNQAIRATEPLPSRDMDPGDYVVIRVSDSGQGMDENTRNHAFEPFFTTKEVGKGSGLGLSMVIGFIQQSQGGVTLQSQPGEGCRVELYLPRSS